MTSRSLNQLAAVWWMTLLVSAAVLFIFALLTPEVALFSSTGARDAAIQSIKSEADTGRLQQMATMYVSAGYATGTTATVLCRVALVASLLIVIGSAIGLVRVRRIRKELGDAKDVA